MATIEFKDEMSPTTAEDVEIHGDWVIADVENDEDEIERHWIPGDRIKRIVGVKGDESIMIT
ncbi:MAG: hypothetical protein V5A38_00480 [Halolamina sp.]|uniref:hypothetical protein n=1 Tax=Halolamina sp. TaxID=1940283 RepID=UPI002FC34ED5